VTRAVEIVAFVIFAAPAVILVSIKFVVVIFTVVKVPATLKLFETAMLDAVKVVMLALAEVIAPLILKLG
jgi:hypothetical protein